MRLGGSFNILFFSEVCTDLWFTNDFTMGVFVMGLRTSYAVLN